MSVANLVLNPMVVVCGLLLAMAVAYGARKMVLQFRARQVGWEHRQLSAAHRLFNDGCKESLPLPQRIERLSAAVETLQDLVKHATVSPEGNLRYLQSTIEYRKNLIDLQELQTELDIANEFGIPADGGESHGSSEWSGGIEPRKDEKHMAIKNLNLQAGPTWHTVEAGGESIDLLMQPMPRLRKIKAATLAATDYADALRIMLDETIRDWRDVTDLEGKPVPFSLAGLDVLLGQHADLAIAVEAKIFDVNGLATKPGEGADPTIAARSTGSPINS